VTEGQCRTEARKNGGQKDSQRKRVPKKLGGQKNGRTGGPAWEASICIFLPRIFSASHFFCLAFFCHLLLLSSLPFTIEGEITFLSGDEGDPRGAAPSCGEAAEMSYPR
jgi:hypothetical protein